MAHLSHTPPPLEIGDAEREMEATISDDALTSGLRILDDGEPDRSATEPTGFAEPKLETGNNIPTLEETDEPAVETTEIAASSEPPLEGDIAISEQIAETVPVEEGEDDFGDFEEFVGAAEGEAWAGFGEDGGDSSWAAFGEATTSGQTEVVTGDDWAAGKRLVEQSEAAATTSATAVGPVVPQPTLARLLVESSLFADSQGEDGSTEDEEQQSSSDANTAGLDGLVGELEVSATSNTCDNSGSRNLWRRTRVVEDALALKTVWLECECYNVFLSCLHMDANLAKLRSCSLPVFAAQLGHSLLTPMSRGEVGGGTSELPAASPRGPPSTTATPVDSLSVPPAQFDWTNSGLENPLTSKCVNNNSAILDLDFLAANERGKVGASINHQLEKELASLGLSSAHNDEGISGVTTDVGGKTTASIKDTSSILEDLMKRNGLTSTPANLHANSNGKVAVVKESALTPQARAIYDRLPDLSYMLSPVLMFPVQRSEESRSNADNGKP